MIENLQRNCDDISPHRIDRNVDSGFSSDRSGFDSGSQNENSGGSSRSVVTLDACYFATVTNGNVFNHEKDYVVVKTFFQNFTNSDKYKYKMALPSSQAFVHIDFVD
jgi:hypothetical protein